MTTSAALTPAVGHDADGDATTVVFDGDRAVEVDRHVHPGAVPTEVLVDRVVDHLPHQVVEARPVVHVADVHPGPLSNGFEALEDGDARAVVVGRRRVGLRGADSRHRRRGSFGGTGARRNSVVVFGARLRRLNRQ